MLWYVCGYRSFENRVVRKSSIGAVETCLTKPSSLSPCCPLCTALHLGRSSWSLCGPAVSSSLASASCVCLTTPPAAQAGCWGAAFVFPLAAHWDSACSGVAGHGLLVHQGDLCPEKYPGFQRATSITIFLLVHWCKFCSLLSSPFSLFLLCWCAPRGGSSRQVNIVSAALVNAAFLRRRPVILGHQVHLSLCPYTTDSHSGPEGTDRLNSKWQIGTDLSLAHLGFRRNIWKQRQLVLKGSLGRGGKYP